MITTEPGCTACCTNVSRLSAEASATRCIRMRPMARLRTSAAMGAFAINLLLHRPYLVLTKPLRLDIQCQRGASVKIGWKYLDD